MGVNQVLFEVPAEIQAGLDAGSLIQWGGVVRDTAGRIVKHLKPLSVTKNSNNAALKLRRAEELTNTSNKLVDSTSSKKGLLVGGGIVATVAIGVLIHHIVKKKRKKAEYVDVPKCIVDFNNHLMTYVKEIRSSSVTEVSIENVLSDLEEIKKRQEEGLIDGDFSYNNAEALLNMVKEYTKKLVEANNQALPPDVKFNNDKIVDLQNYLKIQKNVFKNKRSA